MSASKLFFIAVLCIAEIVIFGCSEKLDIYVGEVTLAGENISNIQVKIPPQKGGLPWRFRFSGSSILTDRKEELTVEFQNLGKEDLNITAVGEESKSVPGGAKVLMFKGSLGGLYLAGRSSIAEPEVRTPQTSRDAILSFKPKEMMPPTTIKIYLVRNQIGL